MKIQSIAYLVFVTIAGSVLPGAAQSGMAEMRSSSGSNIYSYELAHYPTGDQRCEGIAADLAVRLRDEAGVQVYGTDCDGNGDGTANLKINYIAETELTITSTQPKKLMGIPSGMYRSMEECQAGLAAEVSAFQENLGLDSFVSYCFQDPDQKKYPFVARIDAIGVAKDGMRVIDDMELFYSPVFGDTDILGDVMTERLRERGVKVARAVVGMQSGTEYWIGARYYAKASHLMKLREVTSFKSEEACHGDSEALLRVLENGKVPPLAVFCTGDNLLGEARLYFMMIPGDYASEKAPDVFVDREACLNGKAAVEDVYRTSLRRDVIGGLCVLNSRSTGDYSVRVFSNP